ncbi:hypothetical protein B0H13DRAFT_1941489 [Mycena leptocephala]|nr:hypothetical protein B0H13DRAFT_1941489 [Mycena leptocephala]
MALDSFAASPGHTTLSCRLQRDPLSIYEFRTDPLPTSAQSQTLGGCGAQVHMRASYAVRHWCGDEDAISPTVVPLETRYFSQEQRAALTRGRRCGCRLEGVGCAVCGNPLGAQHKPSARFSSCSHQQDAYLFLSSAVSPHISGLCMPEEAERAAILAASTAYSSRPDRARVVGDYAMATPQWSGWEGDEQSENMDDLFWARAVPRETIIWAMSHDDAPSRQDSSGFRDNDAADSRRLRGLTPSVRFDLRPQVAGRRTRRSRPALFARTPTVRLVTGGATPTPLRSTTRASTNNRRLHLWRPTHEEGSRGSSTTT